MGELRAVELADRGFVVGDHALRLHPGDAVGDVRAGCKLDGAIGEAHAQHRVAPDRLVRVLLDELDQPLQRAPAAGVRLDARTLEIERDGDLVPAPVQLADEVLLRNADVFEEDLAEAGLAGHVDKRPDGDARRVHADHERADAFMLRRFRVGARRQPPPLRALGVGRPDLLAVDHEVVAVPDSFRLQRGEVRAGLGLGVERAPDVLAAGDAWQVALLLLVRAVEHDRRADPGDAHAEAARRALVRHLFVVDELLHVGRGEAAVLLGPGHRQPFSLRQLRHHAAAQLSRRFVALFAVASSALPIGRQLLTQKFAHLLAELLLLGRESKVHLVLLRLA